MHVRLLAGCVVVVTSAAFVGCARERPTARTAPSVGACAGKAGFPPGTSEQRVDVGGRSRSFRVHVPPRYDARSATPVVIVLHGGGGSARHVEERGADMDPIADREGFVVVYPQGTGLLATWNGGLCCGRAANDDVDDVGFVAKLLDRLDEDTCVDPKRVYATGISNGALMSHRLACELSDRIAAIAPIAGTIGVASCAPRRPVPVLAIHGSRDAHVPPQGGRGCGPSGASFVSLASTMDGWRTRNRCTGSEPLPARGDGACVEYTGCAAATVLCTIEGGGHSWPGGAPKHAFADCPADGPQSTTFPASEVVWAFFRDNPMR